MEYTMKLADFIDKIEPYIIDDQPIILNGQKIGHFDLAGVFPENKYVVNVTSKGKKVFIHFELNTAEGVQLLGYMLRDLLNNVINEYPKHDLIIIGEGRDAEEGSGLYDYFMVDRMWGDVKCLDYNEFECQGCENSYGGGILGALANWNRGYIEHIYTRF